MFRPYFYLENMKVMQIMLEKRHTKKYMMTSLLSSVIPIKVFSNQDYYAFKIQVCSRNSIGSLHETNTDTILMTKPEHIWNALLQLSRFY